MKKVKLFSVLLVFVLAASLVQAQDTRARMRRQHPSVHRELSVSEEQKKKVKTYQDAYRKNLAELRKKDDITVKEWKTRMETLRKQHRDNMSSVLSHNQKDRVAKLRMHRKKLAELNAHTRTEKMRIHPRINNEQRVRIQKHRAEMMERMRALHQHRSYNLPKKRTMKSILTEEQQKKIKEMRMRYPRKKGTLS